MIRVRAGPRPPMARRGLEVSEGLEAVTSRQASRPDPAGVRPLALGPLPPVLALGPLTTPLLSLVVLLQPSTPRHVFCWLFVVSCWSLLFVAVLFVFACYCVLLVVVDCCWWLFFVSCCLLLRFVVFVCWICFCFLRCCVCCLLMRLLCDSTGMHPGCILQRFRFLDGVSLTKMKQILWGMTELRLNVDYETVSGQEEEFLSECSAELSPAM